MTRFICAGDDFIINTRPATVEEDGPCSVCEDPTAEGLVQPLDLDGGPGAICEGCRMDLDWQEEVV